MNLIQFRSHDGTLLHQIPFAGTQKPAEREADRLDSQLGCLPVRTYAAGLDGIPFYAAFERKPT